jgi:thiol-disulfide isomerase/thioredoxin
VEVSRSLQVELTRADSFRVAITADDNLLPHIEVVKNGGALRLALAPNVKSFWATALKATIAMPTLEGVSLAKRSRVTCKGFKPVKAFQAKLIERSTLEGEIEAEDVALEATGGSRVTLKGSAKQGKLWASDEGFLFLADFALDSAEVSLEKGSRATVHVKAKLGYDLRTNCLLGYLGNPRSTRGTTEGDSLAVPHRLAPEIEGAMPNAGNAHNPANPHHHHAGPAQRTDPPSPDQVAVGMKVPDFALRDLAGRAVPFRQVQQEAREKKKGAIVLCFWCSTCGSCRRVEQQLDQLAKDYQDQALVLALDANAGETLESVKTVARKNGLTLPIFLNPDGRAADLFGTKMTTTTVVIDGEGVLRYCGRFQGDRPYTADALKAVLAGKEVAVKTTPHDGCRIVRQSSP